MKKMLAVATFVLTMAVVVAQADDFTIDWYTVDGGGAMLTAGGDFELSGTIGQPDADVVMTGGDFELAGGFWPGAMTDVERCYGDLDGDDDIDISDLAQLLSNYGSVGAVYEDGDLDEDGDVDISDLAGLLSVYGTSCD